MSQELGLLDDAVSWCVDAAAAVIHEDIEERRLLRLAGTFNPFLSVPSDTHSRLNYDECE